MGEHFSAVISKVGINPAVDVPSHVSSALGHSGYMPVRITLNGHPFRAGLVSLGGGRHRLFINGQMRKVAGVDVGDVIVIEVAFDPEPRTRRMPSELVTSLQSNPEARAAWDALVPSRRNEMLDYLNSLKRPDARERIVHKIIATILPAKPGSPRNGGQQAHQPEGQQLD